MKKVRRGMFETNSSSSHVVIIDESSSPEFVTPWFNRVETEAGVVRLIPGEFGWGVEVLRDWRDRADYAYTHAINYGNPGDLELLRKVIEDYTGMKVEFGKLSGDYYPEGYIDHQSVGYCAPAFESYEALKSLVFSNKSFIIIDNDNG